MSNPILPGFHPDPTVCRVGDVLYLANSSFEYFPGVPLFRSTDGATWEQIGNALTRETQLNVRQGIDGASKGIYAPTLRHHDGVFWLITTNIEDIRRGHLIVTASAPEGPWSDPVYTAGAIGIDPDLAWDEAGRCYLTWSDVVRYGISQVQVDLRTGELLGEPYSLWGGSGLSNPEGPHLLHREGWWYLIVAEGGTHTGHGVSVARSRSVSGPFEGHPTNPVLSHRSTSHRVQAVGHADLVELPDRTWVAYHLGIRQRGSFPRFHTNGRETFATSVVWEDDWPVFVEDSFDVQAADNSFTDDFGNEDLHPRWICPGTDPVTFTLPGNSGLQLMQGRPAEDRTQHRLLATRVTDDEWRATVTLTGRPRDFGQWALLN